MGMMVRMNIFRQTKIILRVRKRYKIDGSCDTAQMNSLIIFILLLVALFIIFCQR